MFKEGAVTCIKCITNIHVSVKYSNQIVSENLHVKLVILLFASHVATLIIYLFMEIFKFIFKKKK